MRDNEDLQLIIASKNGNAQAEEELLSKYKKLVKSVARQYYIVGAEDDDLIQEGMIALFRAITAYNADTNVAFSSFAYSCIKNRILDKVKSANCEKYKALNTSVSISDISTETMVAESAENMAILRENSIRVKKSILEKLSPEEATILQSYIDGKRYKTIAAELNKSEKYIDNSLQKIKRKLKEILSIKS